MFFKFLDPYNAFSINQRFRERRFKFFMSLFDMLPTDRTLQILDVGGTEKFWELMKFPKDRDVVITVLNLEKAETRGKNFISIKGNACDLSAYDNDHFDVVFSNSVIEHLFSFENQQLMAREVMRVGKCYFVQTPNYYFPIEPHWAFPCFQFLPFRTRVFLTRNFDIGHFKKANSDEEAIRRVSEVKLLTEEQMKKLFPSGKVYREKFLGLTKSIVMYHFPV